ncbi:unnamed protein product [Adineta steineri]|uniref:Uncharacterized protein n=1 Tax=Adineta steineri TaxID=433720 RepID=A0A818RSZ3_9BILA|nr:unnamed protein product [Adineta steineri]CAF3661876.1 unnamed protein product [Adineta steineri]
MSAGIYPNRQHFDNLSYISDGRDRISYINDPYAATSHDAPFDSRGVVLRPTDLNKSNRENNITYSYRSGQDNIYGYNNAAFSDISGVDSRGPSMRTPQQNIYNVQKTFQNPKNNGKASRICSKYWYIFVLLTLIILVAIGLGIGFGIFYSKQKSKCHLSCDPSERLVHLNSTHCECQCILIINECEYEPPVCGQFPCFKFNGTGYECHCTIGFHHPPSNNDLTRCEDIDECRNSHICGENQICHNTIGSYNCYCQPGYETIVSSNGIICQDINECLDGTRCSNGHCINNNGSFTCVCNPGFTPDIFNPLHCDDIDECLLSNNCTGNNEICENIPGSYKCICARGYRRDEHNNCININECAESNTTCDINSRCEDRNGSFACCIKTITNQCIECGYDYTNTSSNGMLSFAYTNLLLTTDLSATVTAFAIANTSLRLNAIKKSIKKNKLKKVNNHVRRTRMINGQSVETGQFPWIAALLIKSDYYNSEPRYVCSASLVSSWNIITAAHCLDEQHFRKQWELTSEPSLFKDIFDIRIGVHNLNMNSTDFLQSQSYSIANFTLHSDYQTLDTEHATVKNDIALIKLTKRIERSSKLDWICLPTIVNVHDHNILKVVSYSHTDDDSIQQQLNIRVLDNHQYQAECQRQLNDIAEDAFCAITTNNSSVLGVGDSGAGAMLFDNNTHWQLAGVMSKTGFQKAYSAMTNVSTHIEWLQSLVER